MGICENVEEGKDSEGVRLGIVLKTHHHTFKYLVNHKRPHFGHLDEMVQKLNLPSVRILKHKFDIQKPCFKSLEIVLVISQEHTNELEACTEYVDSLLFSPVLFKLLLTIIQETDDNLK